MNLFLLCSAKRNKNKQKTHVNKRVRKNGNNKTTREPVEAEKVPVRIAMESERDR